MELPTSVTSLSSFLLKEEGSTAFIRDWFPEWEGKIRKDDVRQKWYDRHEKYWTSVEDVNIREAGRRLCFNPYYNQLPARQMDLLLYLYSLDIQRERENVQPGEITVWDVSQNMGRVPVCSGAIPCALPRATPWIRDLDRTMCGAEALLLQGADPRLLPSLRPGVWPSSFLQDLAGNAFTAPAFAAWLTAVYIAGGDL